MQFQLQDIMLRRVRLDEQQLHQEEQRLSQQLQSAEAAAEQSVAALEERMAQLEAAVDALGFRAFVLHPLMILFDIVYTDDILIYIYIL